MNKDYLDIEALRKARQYIRLRRRLKGNISMDLLDKYIQKFNDSNNDNKSFNDLFKFITERNLNYTLTLKEKVVDHELYDNKDEALEALSGEDIVILIDNKFAPAEHYLKWFDIEETTKHIESNNWNDFCIQMSRLVIILSYEDIRSFSKSFDKVMAFHTENSIDEKLKNILSNIEGVLNQ